MRKLSKLLIHASVVLALLSLYCCTAAAQETELKTVEDVRREFVAGYEQRAKEYASQIRTLDNGVQVKRTPDQNAFNGWPWGLVPISYNNYTLNADQRGCGACHYNLADTLGKIDKIGGVDDFQHVKMDMNFGNEITVQMCIDCHTEMPASTLGPIVHQIHQNSAAFSTMGGNCWSCHYASGNGMELWDVVKHNVLQGVCYMSSDLINGKFSWNQEKTIPMEDHFTYVYIKDEESFVRLAHDILNTVPDPENDGAYEAHTFTLDGEVENPFTMTLAEMLETFPLETRTVTFECATNPTGGSMIANSTITGIPVSALLEYAMPKEDAKCLSIPPYGYQYPLEWQELYDSYLAIEMDGQPLTYQIGYPVMLVVPFGNAALNIKTISGLTVTADEFVLPPTYRGMWKGGDEYANTPNVGMFDLREGQIFNYGEEIEFTGYAHAMTDNIVGVEISFDQGASWISCPVENADPTRWVNWSFKWMPENTGAYVIMVRSLSEDGRATPEPVETLFNVQ